MRKWWVIMTGASVATNCSPRLNSSTSPQPPVDLGIDKRSSCNAPSQAEARVALFTQLPHQLNLAVPQLPMVRSEHVCSLFQLTVVRCQV